MAQPTVAVLGGTGRHGRGIALRLARAGYPIVIGSRDPARAAAAIAGWRPGASASLQTADCADAVTRARIVILAVPFGAIDDLLPRLFDHFTPQALVIDVTVPLTLTAKSVSLDAVSEGSTAEHIKKRVPGHVAVSATLKSVPAHLLDGDAPLDCDEFVCADSAEARIATAALVSAMGGVRVIDIGPLSRARSLEHLTVLAVSINRRQHILDARFRVVGL